MGRGGRVILLLLVLLMTVGYGTLRHSGAHPKVELSSWVVYWDMESGLDEYKLMQNRLSGLSYFAASFDAADRLSIPDAVREARQERLKRGDKGAAYITVVNDFASAGGKTLNKDTAVLRRILATDQGIDSHVEEIIALAKAGRYDGVELDYERIWSDDPALASKFLILTYRLSRAAIKEGLKLRIVLEPSAPFDVGFCHGPEYVVMLYNLYGLHSGPGAKADRAFIERIVKRMKDLPDKRTVAFATGGCLWDASSGKAQRFLNEREAVTLRDTYKAKELRDSDSAGLSFRYEDKGRNYIVWYADSETLNSWITLAAQQGIEAVGVWRLGGNVNIAEIKERGKVK